MWVLATSDIEGGRPGSKNLTEAFVRILKEALQGISCQVHCHPHEPDLLVPPYSVQDVFETVDRIYREEVFRVGLKRDDVIADITSGTVTMTSGMLLACALQDRRLQFTAGQNDPMHGEPLEAPEPYAIDVNEALLHRLFFGQLAAEAEASE